MNTPAPSASCGPAAARRARSGAVFPTRSLALATQQTRRVTGQQLLSAMRQPLICGDLAKLTRENVFEVFHSRGQLTVLNHSIFDIFQALDGVDALPPVFAHSGQRALDVFDIQQGTVQLGQTSPNPI